MKKDVQIYIMWTDTNLKLSPALHGLCGAFFLALLPFPLLAFQVHILMCVTLAKNCRTCVFHLHINRWPALDQGPTISSFSCCRITVSTSGDPQRLTGRVGLLYRQTV